MDKLPIAFKLIIVYDIDEMELFYAFICEQIIKKERR
jgi:hypothetical protein